MRLSLAFGILVGLCGWVLGADTIAGSDDVRLMTVAESWAHAVGGNQPDELTTVLDVNYEHIHGTGLVESRTQFLDALRGGTRKYQPIHLEDLRARTYPGFALVTGKFALKVEARGKKIEGINRFCMTLIERPEGWRVLQFQATALPAQN